MLRRTKRIFSLVLIVIISMFPLSVTSVQAATKQKVVAKISSIKDITKTVEYNSSFSMPVTVTAVMSDKTKKSVSVKWDNKLNTSKAGTFKANGTVKGYTKKVVYTLKVKAGTKITKITDITQTVKYRESFTMPSTITAIMSDNSKKTVTVTWDKELTTTQVGTFTASGTVTDFSDKISYTLKVQAPEMGTIVIPKATDTSLKMPSDVKLEARKVSTWDDNQRITIDNTMISVTWTNNTKESDGYYIKIYDQYKQELLSTNYCIGGQEDMTQAYYDIQITEDVTIGTITITPLNSVDGSFGGGKESNDRIGETAVFECNLQIQQKMGDAVTLSKTPTDWDANQLYLTLSNSFTPYTAYLMEIDYSEINEERIGTHKRSRGGNTDKNGKIEFQSDINEYNETYANSSATIMLSVFTNADVKSDTQASVTVTKYPVFPEGKTEPTVQKIESLVGVYKSGKTSIIIVKKGSQFNIIYSLGDGNTPYYFRNINYISENKMTETSENAQGPCVRMELVLEGDTLHFTRILLQDDNYTEKLDLVRTKDNAQAVYDTYE